MKGTLIRQAEGSTYSLTEAAVGGAIARHDVSVAQACSTCLSTCCALAYKAVWFGV